METIYDKNNVYDSLDGMKEYKVIDASPLFESTGEYFCVAIATYIEKKNCCVSKVNIDIYPGNTETENNLELGTFSKGGSFVN